MRRRPALVIVIGALAAGPAIAVATVVPAAARSATAECTYNPVLPTRVVVNRAPTVFHTPVAIVGQDCSGNFSASVSLTHGRDTYELAWQYNSRTATDSIYPVTVRPGVYATANDAKCATTASDGSMKTCAVGKGSTVIKFGGRAYLSAQRLKGSDKDKVQFTARATHYAQYTTAYLSTTVHLQREDSGTWHTIHSATTNGKHGWTWTYKRAQSDRYRVYFSSTSTTFGATSGTLTR